jgi:hypothetical protein
MRKKLRELSVDEPGDFSSPDGPNRVVVEVEGIVEGPDLENWRGECLKLSVKSPFDWNGELVKEMIAAPRYTGVTISGIERNGGTVGVSRVRPNRKVTIAQTFSPEDVEYIIIGSLAANKESDE